jgi:protein SCO1/2
VVAVVLVPISIYGGIQWYEQKFNKLPVLDQNGQAGAKFSFIDQDGSVFTEMAWENKIVVANFFFSHCGSICPKMMYQLKRVQSNSGSYILISSFSVDPERDSASQLKRYAALTGIKGNWKLLTGEKKALYRFARNDLMVTATDGDGGPNDFIHSENLVLIDHVRRIRGFYKGTDEASVNQLIKDIEKLRKERK